MKIARLAILVALSVATVADPMVDALKAFKQQKPEGTFAGVSGTCVSGMAITTLGPLLPRSLRTCFPYFLTKEDIHNISAMKSWPLQVVGRHVEVYKSADGESFYTVVYDKAGNANEILLTLDDTAD